MNLFRWYRMRWSWLGRMCQWIGRVRDRHGFYTPSTFYGQAYFTNTNRADLQLSVLMEGMKLLCRAAEAVRHNDTDDYERAMNYLMIFAEKNMVLRDKNRMTDCCSMTNEQCLDGKLLLVCTEVAEASEGAHNRNLTNFGEELADTYIRLNDISNNMDVDIMAEIRAKMLKNEKRPVKHGKICNL